MGDRSNLSEALDRIARARSINNLRVAMRDILSGFDLRHAAYCGVPPLEEGDTQAWIVLATYPDVWVRRYLAEDYFAIDPVIRVARATFAPIDWMDIHADDPEARKLFEEAAEFGLGGHGMSFPMRGPGGDFGLFSATVETTDDHWQALKARRLADWMALGHAIHRRLLELNAGHMRGVVARLSRREQEILQLTASGLTSAEVAKAFGISERVVRGYLQAGRNKLNALNTTHAVARAVKLGLVSVS